MNEPGIPETQHWNSGAAERVFLRERDAARAERDELVLQNEACGNALVDAVAECERLRERIERQAGYIAELREGCYDEGVRAKRAVAECERLRATVKHYRAALVEHHNIANLSDAVLAEYDYRACPVCARASAGRQASARPN